MTHDEFQALALELHVGLMQSLLKRLTGPKKASAEYLNMASSYLRHFNLIQAPTDPKGRKQLQAIERAYVAALGGALKAEKPSAGLLAEVRRYCESVGVTGTSGSATSPADLPGAALPFNRKH